MDFSKLSRSEWLGLAASALLVVAVLFLPWFDLAEGPSRAPGGDGFLCGDGEFSCTGFETVPITEGALEVLDDEVAGCPACSRGTCTLHGEASQ